MEIDNNTFVIGGQPVGKITHHCFCRRLDVILVGMLEKQKIVLIELSMPVFLIKGEVCHDAGYVLDCELQYNYNSFRGSKNIRYRDLIESLVLPLSTWYELYGYVHDQEWKCHICNDKKSIDFIADVGGSCVKLASNNINNVPLIRHAAKKFSTMIFDTGKAFVRGC